MHWQRTQRKQDRSIVIAVYRTDFEYLALASYSIRKTRICSEALQGVHSELGYATIEDESVIAGQSRSFVLIVALGHVYQRAEQQAKAFCCGRRGSAARSGRLLWRASLADDFLPLTRAAFGGIDGVVDSPAAAFVTLDLVPNEAGLD
jgi:hypothetical protein